MCPLRDSSRSASSDEIEDGYGASEETSSGGWDDDISLDIISQDKQIIPKLIILANNKYSLNSILKSLKLNWSVIPSTSGWTHKTRCPFPDHNDSTPSFTYNSKDDLFKCFGCSRGGKAVDFLAAYTKKPKAAIAYDLVNRLNLDFNDLEYELDTIEDSNTYLDLDIDFSEFIFDFVQRNSGKPGLEEIVNKITWNLDTFIEKYYGKNIDINSFEQRIQLLKNRLLYWEKLNA